MNDFINKNELEFTIDRSSPEPLYLQIGKILENKINNGDFLPGERLPSEDKFIKLFAVSRPTVNKAIEYLITKRIVCRDKGKGTYIENNKVSCIKFNEIIGILDFKGHQIDTNVIQFGELNDYSKVPRWLNNLWENKILYIKRVRYIDKVPFFISEHYLQYKYYTCLSKVDFQKEFLYKALENICKEELVKIEREVRVVSAELEEVKWLKIKHSDPVLKLKGIAYSKNSKPLFFYITRFAAHKVILQGVGYP